MSKDSKYNAYISGIGHFIPPKVINNKYFEKYLETSDKWIMDRTGISERRYLEDDQPISYASTKAIEMLMQERNMTADEIDLIIVATVSPDHSYPSTACIIQNNLGAKNCWGFDLSAACSGFVFAIMTGAQFIESGMHKKVIVVGADKMSILADPLDRNTVVLFGDGAAAVLLEPTEDKTIGILDSLLHIDGIGGKYLKQQAGGSATPTSAETVEKRLHYIYQDGRAVFLAAVKGMADISVEIMEKNNLKPEDVAYLVPHQANLRIIAATADRMKISMDKVMLNIHKYGNTTSATIPLCISEYYREGKLKKGDNIILASFGAGYTWGSVLIKWAI
jgi:3-oxoacyl-[acyl-carrier-protein] synthase III